MSIQTQITRISTAKTAIATAITGKGVTVPSGTKIDGMAALIDTITTGGELESITITTPPTKTNYIAGEDFDPTGMEVTATISGLQVNVNGWTYSPETLTADTTAITISYTVGGVTKTTEQAVSVTAYAWNDWTTNLKVNSSTSSTSSSCYLTWSAASTTPDSPITYWIVFNGNWIGSTSNLYYSVPSSYTTTATSSVTIRVYADSQWTSVLKISSNSVTYTYKSPSTTVSATGSRTKTSSSTDTSSTPIVAYASGTGYAAYTFAASSAFSSFSTAYLYIYVTAAASTLTMITRNGADSWLSYNTGWGNSFTSSTSTGWNTINITSALNTLISDVGASALTSNGLKVYFRSSNTTKIAGYSSSYPAYIVLT